LKAPQKSLKNWTDQKWRTKSGKPSTQGPKATGERYLPESAIKSLSPAEYAATSRAKRAGKAKGKQFVKQPKSIARKTAGQIMGYPTEEKLKSFNSKIARCRRKK
jgi:hypothetical protein